jgi:hypothetical protein
MMNAESLSSLTNAVLYQVGWFAVVAGAGAGRGEVGVALASLLIAVHLALAERPGPELRLLAAAGAIGLVVDSLHAGFGVLAFAGYVPGAVAPLWIVLLWMQFATALHFCLGWLSGRYLLASLLGLIGGPLSFLAGERLGAASFGEPRTLSLAVLALSWAIVLPVLVALADRFAGPCRYRIFRPWAEAEA